MVRWWLMLTGALLFTACPADLEVTPVTVAVTAFSLTTGEGQGAPTTDIREVWAFADGDFLGVFPLPARIPVFRLGQTELRLEAGIRQNGRSVTPDIYPFYEPIVLPIDPVGGETLELGVLPLRYRPEAVFGFVEDFEEGSDRNFIERVVGTTDVVSQREVVRSGAAAGAIILGDTSRVAEIATRQEFSGLNRVPINVWLEVDYLSDAPGIFGVIGQRNGMAVRQFDPGFLPRAEWTKIYFDLGPVIGSANLDDFRISLSVRLEEQFSAGTVYLDNLKLLYLQP